VSVEVSEDARKALLFRLLLAAATLAVVMVVGATGYHILGKGHWSWGDCLYMTVITLSTVGYGEVLHGMDASAFGRAWTVGLILLGSGTLLYFISTLTAFIVEGDLQGAIRRRRMHKRIEYLKDHIIVCGVGNTGIHVVSELLATATPFVIIDTDPMRLAKTAEDFGADKVAYVHGDASDDDVLRAAGIERCRGVVAALHDDKDNLFITVTARALNQKARIVAKAVEATSEAKLRRAGADAVVSTNFIGGMRLVSEMVRPRVVEFLDQMLRDKEKNLRIEEVTIPESSPLVGLAIRDSAIRKAADVLVIAVRLPSGEITHNPRPETMLTANLTLIVLAMSREVAVLRQGIESGSIGRA
jgi:voltage-gated potassium channel